MSIKMTELEVRTLIYMYKLILKSELFQLKKVLKFSE